LFKAAGEEQMLKAIRLGMSRAEAYGFTLRGPVRLHLELMLLFGSYFDSDPQYPWASEILKNQDMGPQMSRAERLYEKAADYRLQVAGPGNAHVFEAVSRLWLETRQSLPFSAENFVPALLAFISRIYPQKAAYIGEEGLRALIDEGIETARRHRLATVRGVALTIGLMLAFGHGCIDDPVYAWISPALKDETVADPAARIQNLEKKALAWLGGMLGYFSKGKQT
jgi:hypothetical protein